MPTERFLRLSREKQEAIKSAAVEEFSNVPFEKVSINRIIRNAGISRGSFYTYFEDKRDILGFMIRDVKLQAFAFFRDRVRSNGGDFWEAMEQFLEYLMGVIADNHLFEIYRNFLVDPNMPAPFEAEHQVGVFSLDEGLGAASGKLDAAAQVVSGKLDAAAGAMSEKLEKKAQTVARKPKLHQFPFKRPGLGAKAGEGQGAMAGMAKGDGQCADWERAFAMRDEAEVFFEEVYGLVDAGRFREKSLEFFEMTANLCMAAVVISVTQYHWRKDQKERILEGFRKRLAVIRYGAESAPDAHGH
ncbi:MAG: TetR family transcriptional regulator [Lachnospiraceae bacterium]|jgi:AcrR family transcriptional regulator|nr:TetR family transcriptional regulator [Lachnospiraceae bacterium]